MIWYQFYRPKIKWSNKLKEGETFKGQKRARARSKKKRNIYH